MTDQQPSMQNLLQTSPFIAENQFFEATVITRGQLVWQHLYAAALFSRAVGSMEAEHQGESLGSFFDDIFAHASPCIIMAAAGVEAFANQIFADREKVFPNFDQHLLRPMWERWGDRLSPLEKFRLAFQIKGVAPLKAGAAPYQDVAALFELRNALVHFKPEWSNARDTHEKLEGKLVSTLKRAPFFSQREPLFPFAWATHDSTKWAVASCIDLIDIVAQSLDLDPKLVTRLRGLTL